MTSRSSSSIPEDRGNLGAGAHQQPGAGPRVAWYVPAALVALLTVGVFGPQTPGASNNLTAIQIACPVCHGHKTVVNEGGTAQKCARCAGLGRVTRHAPPVPPAVLPL